MVCNRKKYVPQRVIQGRAGGVPIVSGTESSGVFKIDPTVNPHKKVHVGLDIGTGGEVNLQDKTVQYTGSGQVITPDKNYDGLSSVTVVENALSVYNLSVSIDDGVATANPLIDSADTAYKLKVNWSINSTEELVSQSVVHNSTSNVVAVSDRSKVVSGTFVSNQVFTVKASTPNLTSSNSITVKWVTPIWWGKSTDAALSTIDSVKALSNKLLTTDQSISMDWYLNEGEYAYIVSDTSWGIPQFISNESGWNEEFTVITTTLKYTDKVNLTVFRTDYPSLQDLDFTIKYSY